MNEEYIKKLEESNKVLEEAYDRKCQELQDALKKIENMNIQRQGGYVITVDGNWEWK